MVLHQSKKLIKKCSNCDKEISVFPSRAKKFKTLFCSKGCHRSYKNRIDNPSWYRDLSGKNNPMYGKHQIAWNKGIIGEKWSGWKGGYTRKDGYRVLKIGGEKILEHRFLLKDKLRGDNIVHHKDRNPSNNLLENLEILENQATHARLHATSRSTKKDSIRYASV